MSQGRPPIPAAVIAAVLARCARRCEICGSGARLDMHHLRYTRPGTTGRRDIFGHETPDDLMALCRSCHDSEHTDKNGIFWRYPDLKRRVAG